LFYYIPVFLVGFLPWSFPLLFAGINHIRGWKRLRETNAAPRAFLLAWALVTFLFFSLSHSKLPAYFLPAVPALALLLADIWNREVNCDPPGRRPDWLTAGFAVLIALGILVAATPAWLEAPSLHRTLARKIHPSLLETLPSSIFFTGLILAALGILGRNLVAKSRGRVYAAGSLAIFAFTMPLLAVRWWDPVRIYAVTSSTERLAAVIERGTERGLPIYGYYYFRTGLPFYLRRPVGLLSTGGSEFTSNYIAAHWPAIRASAAASPSMGTRPNAVLFPTQEEFSSLGHASSHPFLVIVQNEEVPDVAKQEAVFQPLWEAWKYSVWEASGSPEKPPSGQ